MKIKYIYRAQAYFGELIRHDGNGEYLAKGNKWSGNGAGRKSGERERSGERRSRKTMERGAGGHGAGTERRAGVLEMP